MSGDFNLKLDSLGVSPGQLLEKVARIERVSRENRSNAAADSVDPTAPLHEYSIRLAINRAVRPFMAVESMQIDNAARKVRMHLSLGEAIPLSEARNWVEQIENSMHRLSVRPLATQILGESDQQWFESLSIEMDMRSPEFADYPVDARFAPEDVEELEVDADEVTSIAEMDALSADPGHETYDGEEDLETDGLSAEAFGESYMRALMNEGFAMTQAQLKKMAKAVRAAFPDEKDALQAMRTALFMMPGAHREKEWVINDLAYQALKEACDLEEAGRRKVRSFSKGNRGQKKTINKGTGADRAKWRRDYKKNKAKIKRKRKIRARKPEARRTQAKRDKFYKSHKESVVDQIDAVLESRPTGVRTITPISPYIDNLEKNAELGFAASSTFRESGDLKSAELAQRFAEAAEGHALSARSGTLTDSQIMEWARKSTEISVGIIDELTALPAGPHHPLKEAASMSRSELKKVGQRVVQILKRGTGRDATVVFLADVIPSTNQPPTLVFHVDAYSDDYAWDVAHEAGAQTAKFLGYSDYKIEWHFKPGHAVPMATLEKGHASDFDVKLVGKLSESVQKKPHYKAAPPKVRRVADALQQSANKGLDPVLADQAVFLWPRQEDDGTQSWELGPNFEQHGNLALLYREVSDEWYTLKRGRTTPISDKEALANAQAYFTG